ncbi:hypothetical protein LPU83_pLPU83d_0631 (plasmid) [Rhizobium favelukesii]|uniref:Uncharacterized protein n=1 Tax=Rhizobium favelukesii TaxID=348824 RepID=W6RLM1_9HYPH|nr:hypothetical protein LPU83_pLPU83d_0631 [Rhizobium favelukesii]
MSSPGSDSKKSIKGASEALGTAPPAASHLPRAGAAPPPTPAASHLPRLTLEQRCFLEAYRSGQVDEGQFQQRLAEDPVLSDYVRRICRGQ